RTQARFRASAPRRSQPSTQGQLATIPCRSQPKLKLGPTVEQVLAQLPERGTAMADGALDVVADLAERPAFRRVEEDWVVAEAVRAARLGSDAALDRASRLEDDPAIRGNCKRADEARGALAAATLVEHRVETPELLRVRRVRTGEASGLDAWLTVECVHYQSRVFGDCC